MKPISLHLTDVLGQKLRGYVDRCLLLSVFKNLLVRNPFSLEDPVNQRYGSEEVWRSILFCGLEELYFENGVELQKQTGRRTPSADAVLNRIFGLGGERLEEQVNRFLVESVSEALKRFRGRRLRGVKSRKSKGALAVAIDLHLEPYYGNHESEFVVKSRPRNSTNRFFPFATAYLCEEGTRFTLAVTQVKLGERRKDIALRLLDRAEKLLGKKIGWVLSDGEFCDANLSKELDQRGYRFVTRGTLNERVRGLIAKHRLNSLKEGEGRIFCHTLCCRKTGRYCRHPVREVICRRNGQIVPLITNYKGRHGVKKTVEMFSKRFGIESSYRDGRRFRVRTRSNDEGVRLLCFATGLLILNLVILYLLKAHAQQGNSVRIEENQALLLRLLTLITIDHPGKPPPAEKHRKIFIRR